jgi:hypothetical protein
MPNRQQVDTEEVAEGELLPANIKDDKGAIVRSTEFERRLQAQSDVIAEDNKDPYERIIQQVLDAETPDAVLTPTEVLQGRDLLDENIVILGFDLNQSEYDVGAPFYATINVVRSPDSPPVVVNCGHKKVIAQLVRLSELDAFPVQARFITRGVSRIGGTAMLELTKWGTEPQQPPF